MPISSQSRLSRRASRRRNPITPIRRLASLPPSNMVLKRIFTRTDTLARRASASDDIWTVIDMPSTTDIMVRRSLLKSHRNGLLKSHRNAPTPLGAFSCRWVCLKKGAALPCCLVRQGTVALLTVCLRRVSVLNLLSANSDS